MLTQVTNRTNLNLAGCLKWLGITSGTIGILGIVLPAISYAPSHPGFLPFTTYLSDMGATPIWPQVLFNTAMLINTPLRYLFLVLLILYLEQINAAKRSGGAMLIAGAISAAGTVIMTAVPYSLIPQIHEAGIPLFFLGIVILQSLLGASEYKAKALPRVLPGLCFVVVAVYLVFFVLVMLYEMGMIDRAAPIFPEWLCAMSLLVWVFAHSLILGKGEQTHQD